MWNVPIYKVSSPSTSVVKDRKGLFGHLILMNYHVAEFLTEVGPQEDIYLLDGNWSQQLYSSYSYMYLCVRNFSNV